VVRVSGQVNVEIIRMKNGPDRTPRFEKGV